RQTNIKEYQRAEHVKERVEQDFRREFVGKHPLEVGEADDVFWLIDHYAERSQVEVNVRAQHPDDVGREIGRRKVGDAQEQDQQHRDEEEQDHQTPGGSQETVSRELRAQRLATAPCGCGQAALSGERGL